MKKILLPAVLLILVLSLFTSCSQAPAEEYPLTVNSTPLDGEIFRCFLDTAWDKADGKDGRISEATRSCIRYVAVNSAFASYSLSLSPTQKARTAERADALWRLFGEHYRKAGVSKQTYLKIAMSEAYTEKLRGFFFGKGGTHEISENALKSCLLDNYVSFLYVRTPLKTTDVYGRETDFSEPELARLKALYTENVSQLSYAQGTQVAFSRIAADFPYTEESSSPKIITAADYEYSSAFFNAVKKMKEGTAAAVQYGEYMYIVFRVGILNDNTAFETYRGDCLKRLSDGPLQNEINKICGAYRSKRDMRLVNKYYRQIRRIKQ